MDIFGTKRIKIDILAHFKNQDILSGGRTRWIFLNKKNQNKYFGTILKSMIFQQEGGGGGGSSGPQSVAAALAYAQVKISFNIRLLRENMKCDT